jgi:signal transduction histidine kinase
VPILVAAVIVVGEALGDSHGGRPVLATMFGIAAAAMLWGRRRWPAATLVASALLVAALFQIDRSAGVVAMLAPAVALYSLALGRGRTAQLLAGAAAIGAVIMADVLHGGSPSVLQTLGHVLLVSIPLLAAEAIRTHRSYLQVVEERAELAERTREQEVHQRAEQERLRIARELHDLVAHTLTEVNVQAAAAAEQTEPGTARDALERIEDSSHRAIAELRVVLGVLRDPEHPDAPRLPTPGISDIPELVDRVCGTAGPNVHLHIDGEQPSRLSDASSLAAYRIVQESLTNARRHAPGMPVTIELSFDNDRVSILVENPGDGTAANGFNPGVGIQGMRERATAVGGALRAGQTEKGFAIQAELPYQPGR